MQQFFNTALTGLTLGMVYAAFALALVLIWRSTRIVNFAQAPMAMVTTFVALVVIDAGYSYWLGFVAALVSGLVLGAAALVTAAVLDRVLLGVHYPSDVLAGMLYGGGLVLAGSRLWPRPSRTLTPDVPDARRGSPPAGPTPHGGP